MLKHKINWLLSKLSIKAKAKSLIIPIVGISCMCIIFGASYKLGTIYSGNSKDKSTTKKLATVKVKPNVKKKKDDNKTVVSQQTQNNQPTQKTQQNNVTNNQQNQNKSNTQNNVDNNKSTNNNLNSANVKSPQSTPQTQGKTQNTPTNAQNTGDGYSRSQRIAQMESQIKYFEDHGDQKDAQWMRDQLHAFQGNH